MPKSKPLRLTADELAILEGATQHAVVSPGNDRGRAACRRLDGAGLLKLVGWMGADVTTPKAYAITPAGREALVARKSTEG